MPEIRDPTAQTLPLTRGQQIVADYEMDIIAEPCELAQAIDDEIEEHARKLAHMIAYAQQWEQLGRDLIKAWSGGDIQKASLYEVIVKAERMLADAPQD